MIIVNSILLVLHVLSAVFWAGATFVLARQNGEGAARLFGPHTGASIVAVLIGGYLWFTLFGAGPGNAVLAFGAACGLGALVVQFAMIRPILSSVATNDAARARAGRAHRIAAGLLTVAIACMVLK